MGKPNMYIIPQDQKSSGHIGPFETRRLLESCAVITAIGYPVIKSAFSMNWKVIALAVIAVPLFIVTLAGIYGDSLFTFVWHVVLFLSRRRKSVYRRIEKHGKTK